MEGKKPKLGSGERFEHLEHALASKGAHAGGGHSEHGAHDPAALAAWIGRKKEGAKKFAQLAAHGRHEAAMKRHK